MGLSPIERAVSLITTAVSHYRLPGFQQCTALTIIPDALKIDACTLEQLDVACCVWLGQFVFLERMRWQDSDVLSVIDRSECRRIWRGI